VDVYKNCRVVRGGYVLEIDQEIIIRCKKNDKAALIYLFHKYEKYLYNLCYGYLQNEQDALDLVQEIFIKVFNNLSRFDEKRPFHPWIRKISVNTCLNFKRDKKNNVISLNYEISDEITVQDTIASAENIEKEIVDEDVRKTIRDNIKTLPKHYRLIIVLRYYEDLSYNEISILLNKPSGTIKTDIYRAKAMLKKSLEGALEA
jgi:RNA polymerase sigma-70 factor, ECF subfamily